MCKSINLSVNKIALFLLIVGNVVFGDVVVIRLGVQFVAIGLSLLNLVRQKKITRYIFSTFVWVVVFSSFCLASEFWAKNYNVTVLSTSIAYVQFGCILLSILVLCQTEKLYECLLEICIISGVLLCLRFWVSVPISQWGNIRSSIKTGIFSSNNTAEDLAYISVLLIWMSFIKNKSTLKEKVFSILLVAMFVFVVLMMGTKKGLVIFGLCSVILYLSQSKNPIKTFARILIILTAIYLCYRLLFNIPFFYNSIGERIDGMIQGIVSGTGDGSTNARMAFIKNALDVFIANPIVGVGNDGFRYENTYSFSYSHNNYVELLANLGFLGFFIYYSYFLSYFKKSIVKIKDNILPFVIIVSLLVIDFASVSYSNEDKAIFMAIFVLALEKSKNGDLDEMNICSPQLNL